MQVGPESVQTGPESVSAGPESVSAGPESVSVGRESVQAGSESRHEAESAQPPRAVPEPPAGQAAGRQPGGRGDYESVSQRWPEILDAVKSKRRVAWMLLSNAAVHSVEDGVLTVRFAREGDVKGFSSSGCDRDLGSVLETTFGFRLQVRAVYAAQLGGAPANPGPRDLPPHPAAPAAQSAADSGWPDAARPDPARPDPARADSARTDLPRPQAAQSHPDRAGTSRSDTTRPGTTRPGVVPAEHGPTASAPVREDLTGMDLIKRELGGKIIAEIDEA